MRNNGEIMNGCVGGAGCGGLSGCNGSASGCDRLTGGREFLIATGNPGKFTEIKAILEDLPFAMDFLFPVDLGILAEDLEETGDTYEANAILKAEYYAGKSGMGEKGLVVADDSGLVVEELAGELGLNTRRWGAGADATDQEWIDHFLQRMKGVKNRQAKFICFAALMVDGKMHVFEGEAGGEITHEQEAEMIPGLPLSSVFRPEGYDKVYAALTKSDKGRISHRGFAVNRVRDFLAGTL